MRIGDWSSDVCSSDLEDEDPVRLFSARALRNKGYKVLEARSGDMALQVLDAAPERVDVVVTDVVMPRMDGPTLIGKLREQRPEIKIICISGYAEGAFRQKLERDRKSTRLNSSH